MPIWGKSNAHKPNFALLISILALIVIGSVLISSASVVLSQQLSSEPNHFFKEHLYSLIGGFALMFLAYKIDYSFWRKVAPFLILVAMIAMVAVFIPGFGIEHNGATRWLILGPINFAPSEVFKFALIVYLAAWFEKKGSDVKSFFGSLVPFLTILVISVGLIMAQSDLGTMIVVAVTSGMIYFVAGASWTHVIAMGVLGIGGVSALIATSQYRIQRFMIFLNPTADSSGSGYQINQALLAIGSGKLFGLGFGQSRQKFNYLPEAASDSIFAITAEELGFIRTTLIFLLYLVLAREGYRVAQKAPDVFSRLLATGITTWITIQAIINVFAMLSLVPLTGVPLPFVSLGSSSTIMLMLASGILLNISKHTEGGETREGRSNRRRNWWTYLTGSSSN